MRVDPGPPAQRQTMLCLPSEYFTGMGAAPDGSIWVGWLPRYRVNPATAFPDTFGWGAVEVDAAGRVYIAPSQSGLAAVERTSTASTQIVLPIGFEQTGAVLDMAMVSATIPEPDGAALALVAILSLGALSARATRRRPT